MFVLFLGVFQVPSQHTTSFRAITASARYLTSELSCTSFIRTRTDEVKLSDGRRHAVSFFSQKPPQQTQSVERSATTITSSAEASALRRQSCRSTTFRTIPWLEGAPRP